jgi:predicted acetyltransferase
MSSEALPAHVVEVLPAAPEQEPVLANLLELYAHDLSVYFDLQLQSDGRFGYPRLSSFWQEENRFAFLIRADGHLAGFVLVARGSRISGDPRVWDVAEFFVVRRYRKRGVGTAAAAEVWRRFPGAWEVRVLEGNQPARAFWEAAIHGFAGPGREEVVTEARGKRWRVFSFHSAETAEAG